jgi:hypothetical protein
VIKSVDMLRLFPFLKAITALLVGELAIVKNYLVKRSQILWHMKKLKK